MSVSALDHVLLRRQAILDAESELVGYSLALAEGSPPALPENTRVAALVCAAYAELGIRSALGQKLAYLHADPGFIHDDVIEALPPDGVVLELVLDPDLAPDAPTLERCRALRERHYALALADYRGLDDVRPICFASGGPIPVYCEERVEQRIRKAFDYAFQPMPVPGGGVPKIHFERITTEPFTLLNARVLPLRLRHGVFDVLGFRFGDLAYCTDTNEIPDATWPLLEGLDTLVLDCLRPSWHPTHFSLDEAIAVARRVKARRTLFVHMSHDIEHGAVSAALPPGVEIAYDGLAVPVVGV